MHQKITSDEGKKSYTIGSIMIFMHFEEFFPPPLSLSFKKKKKKKFSIQYVSEKYITLLQPKLQYWIWQEFQNDGRW